LWGGWGKQALDCKSNYGKVSLLQKGIPMGKVLYLQYKNACLTQAPLKTKINLCLG
jgi:hypothetical protein